MQRRFSEQTNLSGQAGYTLFEILIALTIVALLVGLSVNPIRIALISARAEQAIPYLRAIAAEERSYFDSRGEYYQPEEWNEQLLIDTLGVPLQESGDFCYVVRTSNFISNSSDTPEFEVWAILRDNNYSGSSPAQDVTSGVTGTEVSGCMTATNKVHAGGWVASDENELASEGRVVVLRYPPPRAEIDSAVRNGRSIYLQWRDGISTTDPLL
ncbi:type II secretion system protein [Candidatus Magnetaquicoccus inordinatus]|uniref:type II secretion system protein n=1 Tax=Candidatus Magnetaquicoccus inordinatus TaxID=2496818 RepID=UPI00102AB372|nr:type II secretion system protein [Candidatus Magnetaquicoccus inordinatus]